LKISVEVRDKATFYAEVAAGKFQMWHFGGAPGVAPWDKIFNWYHSKGANTARTSRLTSAELDAKIDAARNESNMDTKKKLMSVVDLCDQQYIVVTGSQDPSSYRRKNDRFVHC
jgi:ABC-type transport system substrate-binding protein